MAIDNAQLLKDLGRKNRLLQLLIEEAHHRIKNNLQMISGLLQLEADKAQVDSSREFLRTAITRIQAIAQVHNLRAEVARAIPRHVEPIGHASGWGAQISGHNCTCMDT